MTASQHTRWELTLTSTKTYANPFTDVTVTVEYTKAGSPTLRGYGFWDGGTTFKLRQAFPEPGTWHYKTTATDPSNSGLHNREGEVYVLPVYRHQPALSPRLSPGECRPPLLGPRRRHPIPVARRHALGRHRVAHGGRLP